MKTVAAHRADAQVQIYFCRGLEQHQSKYTRKGTVPGARPSYCNFLMPQNYNRRASTDTLNRNELLQKNIPRFVQSHKKNLQKSDTPQWHAIFIFYVKIPLNMAFR